MDILKIRGKARPTIEQEQDDEARMQNAYQKIIFKRMPILPRLLQDFGVRQEDFHELSFAKIRAIYQKTHRSKYKDYKPIFENLKNKKRYTKPDEGLFEEVRNDRLKAEIFVDFDINIDQKNNLSFLESTQELVVSLGDRKIFTNKKFNTYMDGNAKIINLLSVLYPKKEEWAAKNIYTTVRINGQSIRSFMYTMNKLYGKNMSGEELYIFYNGTDNKDVMKFPKFIETITGKSLLYYGGGQTKLGKSVGDTELMRTTLKEIFKERFGREYPYSDMRDIEIILPYPAKQESLKKVLVLHRNKEDIIIPKFTNLTVLNSISKLRPRKLVTRERQAKEKDFSVEFPVYEIEIYGYEVKMIVQNINVKVRFKSNKFNTFVISNIKQKKAPTNYIFRDTISTWRMGSDRQREDYMSNRPTAREKINREFEEEMKRIREMPRGSGRHKKRIEMLRLLDQFDEDDRVRQKIDRDIESEWRKKLRRKQFPHNLLYIKHEGKYLGLYSIGDIYEVRLRI
tara:strand:- start:494 stop:2026 length:1533 start_codon:yes stop_codon:yes gene_type:complete